MGIDNKVSDGHGIAYSEVVDMFGIEDRLPSEMLFKLVIFCPHFGPGDLIGVFRAVAAEFRGKNDVNPALVRNPVGFLTRPDSMIASKTYFSSDVILRNLYRIMFQSSEWDSEILFQPDFIGDFCRFVDEMKPSWKNYSKNYGPGAAAPFNRALDLHEMLLEFKDKLVDKAKMASGV